MNKLSWVLLIQIVIFSFWGFSCNGNSEKEKTLYSEDTVYENRQRWQVRAEKMVKEQIEERGIRDSALLKAMKEIPRHRFVPSHLTSFAYNDYPLPIGHSQTISQPYIVALMTELLHLTGKEKVLEIGTGSGYQAAVLSVLAKEVYTIEIVQPLFKNAQQKLKEMGYDRNVYLKWGDGYKGWPEHAPFDCIIVTAAPETVPEALIEQLAPGGIMVIPVGTNYQELLVIRKTEQGITKQSVIAVRFVPMVHPDKNIP